MVQEAVISTFRRIDRFELRGEGALQAYLRQSILNRLVDEVRRAERRGRRDELDEAICRMADGRRSNSLSARRPSSGMRRPSPRSPKQTGRR